MYTRFREHSLIASRPCTSTSPTAQHYSFLSWIFGHQLDGYHYQFHHQHHYSLEHHQGRVCSPAYFPAAGPAAVDLKSNFTSPTNTNGAQVPGQPKCRAHRANITQRRATHNAVGRMRRETLDERFLILA
ncbi:hypothetical protein B0H14DRAFT_3029163 [Mycena olivaceomarginata]|nr:hypothetical protein B0H14DRAFT_3029163 [Mycena olivaceomarginata]